MAPGVPLEDTHFLRLQIQGYKRRVLTLVTDPWLLQGLSSVAMGTYCGHIDVDEKAIGPPPGPARMYWDNPASRNRRSLPGTCLLTLPCFNTETFYLKL